MTYKTEILLVCLFGSVTAGSGANPPPPGIVYDGTHYKYALYYTADAGGGLLNNTVGAAFSNDGENWTGRSEGAVIFPDGTPSGYDAGMSSVAWDPVDGTRYVQVYLDSTISNHILAKYSIEGDGTNWTSPGVETCLANRRSAERS